MIGAGLAGASVAMIVAFDRWQTRSLPPLLVRNLRGRWPLPVTVLAVAGGVALFGGLYLGDPAASARGYYLACLVTAPLAIGCAAVLLARFVAARRTH